MKKVLVTGSSGLIGSAAVRHFDSLGWSVVGVDNNMRKEFFRVDLEELERFAVQQRADIQFTRLARPVNIARPWRAARSQPRHPQRRRRFRSRIGSTSECVR